MIEGMSYTKEKGYFIYLKEGFINDVTGSRSIHCEKTSEVRRVIGKTHKKKAGHTLPAFFNYHVIISIPVFSSSMSL